MYSQIETDFSKNLKFTHIRRNQTVRWEKKDVIKYFLTILVRTLTVYIKTTELFNDVFRNKRKMNGKFDSLKFELDINILLNCFNFQFGIIWRLT